MTSGSGLPYKGTFIVHLNVFGYHLGFMTLVMPLMFKNIRMQSNQYNQCDSHSYCFAHPGTITRSQ